MGNAEYNREAEKAENSSDSIIKKVPHSGLNRAINRAFILGKWQER